MPHRLTRKSRSYINSSVDKEYAGEVVAAGGFGCVFRPPIKCQDPALNAKLQTRPYITKLLTKKNAKEEMKENIKILPIVKQIPNYKDYFLLDDIFECENFGPLSEEDKKGFNTKCDLMNDKLGITASNVNDPSSLSKMSTINIPDGGVSISSEMKIIATLINNRTSTSAINYAIKMFGLLNWGLIDTLENAIVPMNALGLLHLDLKGDNMLVNTGWDSPENINKMPNITVIDWGLAGVINTNVSVIPEVKNRPLMFNSPFSNILFTLITNAQIRKYIIENYPQENNQIVPKSFLKTIASKLLEHSAERIGEGHTGFISMVLGRIRTLSGANYDTSNMSFRRKWSVNDMCFNNGTLGYNYLVDYIAKVLDRYLEVAPNGISHGRRFNMEKYFNEVYKYNVDVWGFLMSYVDFCVSFSDVGKFRSIPLNVHVSDILFKYCFGDTYAADRIPIDELVKDLTYLSVVCGVPKPTLKNRTPMPNMSSSVKSGQSSYASSARSSLKSRSSTYMDPPAASRRSSYSNRGLSVKSGQSISSRSSPSEIQLAVGRKRCPRGYRIIANTNRCRKIQTKTKKSK